MEAREGVRVEKGIEEPSAREQGRGEQPFRELRGPLLRIPADALVALVGAAGCGKSTFARRHFPAEAVLSSDAIRAELLGDAADQSRQELVWGTLLRRLRARLAAGRLAVLDATTATPQARQTVALAAQQAGRPLVFLVFDVPLELCLERNAARVDPQRSAPVPTEAVARQHALVQRWLEAIRRGEEVVSGASYAVLTPQRIQEVEVRLEPPEASASPAAG